VRLDALGARAPSASAMVGRDDLRAFGAKARAVAGRCPRPPRCTKARFPFSLIASFSLHHRADLPGHEFRAAEAQFLGLRLLARGDAQEQLENLAALGLDADASVMMSPQLMSMSSDMRSYISELVASLMQGVGL
jgi:hypothetical protein